MQSTMSSTDVAKLRACGNCSRAKAKCISQFDDVSSQQCARCFRLKKECVVQPRAKRKKRAPNAVATSELESKIESLVNLLSAAQGAGLGHVDDRGVPGYLDVNLSGDRSFNKVNNDFTMKGRPSQLHSAGTSLRTDAQAITPSTTVSGIYTPAETASTQNTTTAPVKSPDELLHLFRSQFMVHFPYAVISSDVTATELHGSQPWLYRMIMMAVSSHERYEQIEAGKSLISELSTTMLIEGEKNLDMLRALLVYASWSQYFAAVLPQIQSNGIIYLALALIFDLALHKAVREEGDEPKDIIITAKQNHAGERNDPQEEDRSLDERRALLYTFYLSSTISTSIRKADGLQLSPYIDYSCKILLESAECEADQLLVACVRFQSIADSVYRALPYRKSGPDGHNAPIWMQNSHLQNELQSIFNNLSSDLQDNLITKLSYHGAELVLIDAAIQETSKITTFSSRRVDLRWSCLMVGKSLLDAFSNLPTSAYNAIAIPNMAQVAFCLMMLTKLTLVEIPGWDLAHVRETLDLASYFEHFASNLEQIGNVIDCSQHKPAKESFPTVCSRAMIWARDLYSTKVASGSGQPSGMVESSYEMLHSNTLDYLNEINWQELMADFC